MFCKRCEIPYACVSAEVSENVFKISLNNSDKKFYIPLTLRWKQGKSDTNAKK